MNYNIKTKNGVLLIHINFDILKTKLLFKIVYILYML